VVFGGRDLIVGVVFGGRGLIIEVVFDGRDLILYSTKQVQMYLSSN
jgi:hypothetical protein